MLVCASVFSVCGSFSEHSHINLASSLSLFMTDIPLLPSISSLNTMDDEDAGGPFTVHWLNNKELNFTLAMEVFLQQLRSSLELQNDGPQEGTVKYLDRALMV